MEAFLNTLGVLVACGVASGRKRRDSAGRRAWFLFETRRVNRSVVDAPFSCRFRFGVRRRPGAARSLGWTMAALGILLNGAALATNCAGGATVCRQ